MAKLILMRTLYEAIGAHGIYLDGRMQRGFRDVVACGAHAGLNWDRAAVEYGRSETQPSSVERHPGR